MEDNLLKRQEEEARLRALEERIRSNQQNRLKTLESELYRREQEFTKAKMEELDKLKSAEEERVKRSIDFKH